MVTLFFFQGQLRFEGLQDYLKKLVGPSGYLEKKHSVFDFLRSKRAVSDVVKTFNDLKEKVGPSGLIGLDFFLITTAFLQCVACVGRTDKRV